MKKSGLFFALLLTYSIVLPARAEIEFKESVQVQGMESIHVIQAFDGEEEVGFVSYVRRLDSSAIFGLERRPGSVDLTNSWTIFRVSVRPGSDRADIRAALISRVNNLASANGAERVLFVASEDEVGKEEVEGFSGELGGKAFFPGGLFGVLIAFEFDWISFGSVLE